MGDSVLGQTEGFGEQDEGGQMGCYSKEFAEDRCNEPECPVCEELDCKELHEENDRLMLLLEECYSALRVQRKATKTLLPRVKAALGV